jgi:hypothetical protein
MTMRGLGTLTIALGCAGSAGCENHLPPPVVSVTPAKNAPPTTPVAASSAISAEPPAPPLAAAPAQGPEPLRIELVGKDIVLGGKVVDTMGDDLWRHGSLVLSEFALARTTETVTGKPSRSLEPFELVVRDDTTVRDVTVVTESMGIALPRVRLKGAAEVEYQAYSSDETPFQGGRYLSLDVQGDKVSVFWLKASSRPRPQILRAQSFAGLDALAKAARAIASRRKLDRVCEPIVIQTEAEAASASIVPLIHAAQVGCAKGQWLTARVNPIFNRDVAESAAAASHPRQGGFLPPVLIRKVVRQNYGRFRMCYEAGFGRGTGGLDGRVSIRFVIGLDGVVSDAQNSGSDLPDSQTVACVADAYRAMVFPRPIGGIVTVVYPIMFSPGG